MLTPRLIRRKVILNAFLSGIKQFRLITRTADEQGQALIEYAMIILLIILGVLLILGLIGGQVQEAYQTIFNGIAESAGS
jgi:Flp pilus assembly pilin Flp